MEKSSARSKFKSTCNWLGTDVKHRQFIQVFFLLFVYRPARFECVTGSVCITPLTTLKCQLVMAVIEILYPKSDYGK